MYTQNASEKHHALIKLLDLDAVVYSNHGVRHIRYSIVAALIVTLKKIFIGFSCNKLFVLDRIHYE